MSSLSEEDIRTPHSQFNIVQAIGISPNMSDSLKERASIQESYLKGKILSNEDKLFVSQKICFCARPGNPLGSLLQFAN